MRIISGRFKGRNLKAFKADHIRPTTDRVKETIFNILQMDIPESRVLDLFAGTGNLSIEALSRGASYVESVELNNKSLAIIKQNLEMLKIENEIKVIKSDVLKYLKKYSGNSFDIVLIDPPFTEKMAHDCLVTIDKSNVVGDQTRIMIESTIHERVDDEYETIYRVDKREFGDKIVSFFERKENE